MNGLEKLHLAAAKRGQRLHGQLCRRVRDGADGHTCATIAAYDEVEIIEL